MNLPIRLATSLLACAAASTAYAQSMAELVSAAEKKPAVTWYESSPSEQADKVLDAFSAKYPSIKIKHTRLVLQ